MATCSKSHNKEGATNKAKSQKDQGATSWASQRKAHKMGKQKEQRNKEQTGQVNQKQKKPNHWPNFMNSQAKEYNQSKNKTGLNTAHLDPAENTWKPDHHSRTSDIMVFYTTLHSYFDFLC